MSKPKKAPVGVGDKFKDARIPGGTTLATAETPKTRYVIQRQRRDEPSVWEDETTILVAKKTRRTSVLLTAVRDKRIADVRDTDRFRVLDEEQARALSLEADFPSEPAYRVVTVEED